MMKIIKFTLKIICKSDVKNVIPVAITIDMTWQKQYGFSSLLGVAFTISVDTGDVLDFEVKCKHCFECRCSINHKKSADKWYKKHRQKLRQNIRTRPAHKENYLSL